jgi:SAM-dependent methyltransferase
MFNKNRKRELLIGAGEIHTKILGLQSDPNWHHLTTLDIDSAVHPDVVWDLNEMPLPFKDGEFDEVHAYNVLEHLGTQGDYRFFFDQFNEFGRILKKGGLFLCLVPKLDAQWAYGDPGHTRVITEPQLSYLHKEFYHDRTKSRTDGYFPLLHTFWQLIYKNYDDVHFQFI